MPAVFYLVAAVITAQSAAALADFTGRVVRVHDGDTLTVLVDHTQIRVRLTDIDAPELGQAFGKRSRQSLADMCAGRVAQVADRGKDRYRRTLGQVNCGGLDANTEQVRRGMAWVYVRYAPKNSALYQLESAARARHVGLWAEPAPVPPWEWRRVKR